MCSYFLQRMENYQGDLTDIVRASGGAIGGGGTSGGVPVPVVVGDSWQFPMNYPCGFEDPTDDFGDPFSNMRDPLLHELGMPASLGFFNSSNNSTDMIKVSVDDDTAGGFSGGGGGSVFAPKIILDEEMKRPCNIFSRMLQISPAAAVASAKLPVSPPCDSPRGIKNHALVANDMISPNTSKACLVENSEVQISSPRNTGIKRRKSQAKKVVCIPAPAPANSRPSGEIVPSDLWAWRKYGQKPIKGSPYPRGYYRCSSSKGCSARKQVERSRADPNMLVITYTSEHNHPWPTQRNALAGSTRSQPSKNNAGNSKNSPGSQSHKTMKEEQKEGNTDIMTGNSTTSPLVKEEMEDLDKQIDMDDGEFNEGFPQSYRPALPDSNLQSVDFFADLGELEADPLNLLFTQGFSGDEERENNKALDPFSLFDWTGNNNNNSNNTSFGEAKRGL
uniref:Putative WRKY transcription factor 14 n=1 Tax=Davidia involucrata TaxID=16924 RepID=A0A5B7B2G2_DAVIN